MATSKTLTPTNVTIQIPEFTEQPDQRVNSNCIDKEADAINALNTQIAQENIKSSLTLGANVDNASQIFKQGKIIYVSLKVSSLANNDVLISGLGSAYKPIYGGIGTAYKASDGKPIAGAAWAEATTEKITYYGDNANYNCFIQFVYMCN